MGKSDDSITRRKNKKSRKKQEVKDSSKVSYRIASIIAAKKRRLNGKRRMCQGMCFSIPTAEDPFNDRYGKTDAVKNKKRPLDSRVDKTHMDKKRALSRNMAANKDHENEDVKKEKLFKLEKIENNTIASVTVFKSEGKKDVGKPGKTEVPMLQACGSKTDERGHEIFQDCPSKFLVLCLNTIQNALQHESAFSSEDRPFFVHKWGVEFWKFYSSGRDIVETSGADSDSEQIAWVVSCAADTIARKEKGGLSFSSPFLLFIVPSQEKAAKVRKICKPLKALGIHTVSLHPGASIDHQIRGSLMDTELTQIMMVLNSLGNQFLGVPRRWYSVNAQVIGLLQFCQTFCRVQSAGYLLMIWSVLDDGLIERVNFDVVCQ
ncbi:uncharacterized protein [Coffea arabica]|uniref:Uncharacterized protein isoform X3 n=1 Tax=Coffea arabica TaxID=13443 RepID=A0A6P6VPA3_COFAR|nr:uncharacterized protein LOC113725718 isoform X3 [Coffea arabica]